MSFFSASSYPDRVNCLESARARRHVGLTPRPHTSTGNELSERSVFHRRNARRRHLSAHIAQTSRFAAHRVCSNRRAAKRATTTCVPSEPRSNLVGRDLGREPQWSIWDTPAEIFGFARSRIDIRVPAMTAGSCRIAVTTAGERLSAVVFNMLERPVIGMLDSFGFAREAHLVIAIIGQHFIAQRRSRRGPSERCDPLRR
jgi:hypothetical protein